MGLPQRRPASVLLLRCPVTLRLKTVAQKVGTGLRFYRREFTGYLIARSVDEFVCFSLIWFDFALRCFAQMKFYSKAQSVKSIKVEPLC